MGDADERPTHVRLELVTRGVSVCLRLRWWTAA